MSENKQNITECIKNVNEAGNEIRAKIEAEKGKLLEFCKIEFARTSKVLFEAYPRLKSFGWTQYTPYFSDGDECVFSANTDDVKVNGYSPYDDDENDDSRGENLLKQADKYSFSMLTTDQHLKENQQYNTEKGYPVRECAIGSYGYIINQNYEEEASQIVENVKLFLENFDSDILKAMFGDHIRVTVTANGVETEEYNHD